MNMNVAHTVSPKEQLSSQLRQIEIFQMEDIDHNTTLILKLSNGMRIGWGEYRIHTSPPADLVKWASTYQHLAGMSAIQAIDYLVRDSGSWNPVKVQLMESALLDLCSTGDLIYNANELLNQAVAYYIFILE